MSFYDRDYNRRNDAPMSGRQMLISLIIINIAAYFIVGGNMYDAFALTVKDGSFRTAYIWQIFTAAFLHRDFWHLFFNMWGLYIFGSLVADHVSAPKMLLIYIVGGAIGNLLFILFNLQPVIPMRVVGASGAVCAVMAAAATVEPNRRFMIIFMPFTPIKTTTLVICYTIMEVLMELSRASDGVAHLAHLGGFLGGYLIMRIFYGRRLPWDPFRALAQKLAGKPPVHRAPRWEEVKAENTPPPPTADKGNANNTRVSQRELDALLNKLSEYGINSLSEYELERLRKARKQMRGEE